MRGRIASIWLWTWRAVGGVLVLLGLYALGADVFRSAANGAVNLKPLGQVWYETHPASLNLAQALVQRYLFPELWDRVIFPVLDWPAWVLPLAFGGLLAFLTWRRTARE
jgi:hypothetical protein